MKHIISSNIDRSPGNPIGRLARRFEKLSLAKKLTSLAAVVLFLVVIVAAYHRAPLVFVPASILLVVGGALVALKVDAVLKSARATAKRSSLLLQSVPESVPDPATPLAGTASSWASNSSLHPAKLVQRLTKLRSLDGRDILVRKVTNSKWGWNDLETALEMYRLGGQARTAATEVLDTTINTRLLHIADLCYRQNLRAEDMLNAATIYRYVYQNLGSSPFLGKKRGEFFLDALSQTGRGEQSLRLQGLYDAEKLNPNDLHLFRANAMNPSHHESHTAQGWLAEINAMYRSANLAPISLRAGSGPAFARLSTDPVTAVDSGPLVTIVMPVFRPDEYTDLAIQSALDQSYRNLEIIVVDDGSGEQFTHRLDKWEKADPRMKIVRNTTNSGAYTSRNIGYSLSTGRFITIFDGDDWQHPQKIQLLVEAAVKQGDHRLITAPWSRVNSDLMFHYRGWKGAYVTPAHVSALFSVDLIREKLGFWDAVRKAADTEFILRYQLLINEEDPLEVTDVPLTLSLVSSTNLSMDDFRLGYRSPDRVAYRASYEHWHRKVQRGEHSGYLEFGPAERSFRAPAEFLPRRGEQAVLDRLIVGDFGAAGFIRSAMWAYVGDCQSRGLAVGLMHMPSILNSESINASFPEFLLDEFEMGSLLRVEQTDRVYSEEVHLYDPTAFEFSRELPTGHEAGRIVIHANTAPFNRQTNQHRYSVKIVTRNAESMFGAMAHWEASDRRVANTILRNLAVPTRLTIADAIEQGPEEDEHNGIEPQPATALQGSFEGAENG